MDLALGEINGVMLLLINVALRSPTLEVLIALTPEPNPHPSATKD